MTPKEKQFMLKDDDRLDRFLASGVSVSKPKIQALAKYHLGKIPMCFEIAAMGAEALTSCGREDVYLVYANSHVVVYDLRDTWDFQFNAVFRNYRYPMLNLPKLEKIWKDVPLNDQCKQYYRFNEVSFATYKLVRNL